MSGIFISYRRDDTQGFAGRLANDLSRAIGPDRVFSDIEIPSGRDFGEVLGRAITACDTLLVVIGRRWATDAGEGKPSDDRVLRPMDTMESRLTIGWPRLLVYADIR